MRAGAMAPAGPDRHDGRVWALHLGVLGLLALLQAVLPPFHHGMVTRIMLLAAFAAGYNLLLGYTGLMSLGHALLFAAGLYAAGLGVYYGQLAPLLALGAGVAAGLAAAALVGAVALRTTGVAFLIVTLMVAQMGFLTTLHFNRITGGDQGLTLTGRLRPLALGPWHLDLALPAAKYNLALAVLAAGLLLSLWVVRSPLGRVLRAVRENEERVRLLGYDPFRYKLLALVLSGGLAGAAGAGYALLFAYVGSAFADVLYSILPLLWVLVGGAGTTLGPLVGTALMVYVVDVASGLTTAYLFVVGGTLLLLVLWFPQGIVGTARARWWPWLP